MLMCRDRPWHIQGCNAKTGDGIQEVIGVFVYVYNIVPTQIHDKRVTSQQGMEWVVNQINEVQGCQSKADGA